MWLVAAVLSLASAEVSTNLDVKSFFVTVHPFDHILMPPSDTAQGFLDTRARLQWDLTDNLSLEAHHVVTAGTPMYQTQLQLELAEMGVTPEEGMGSNLMTGVGLQAPEAIELSWRMEDSDLFLQGRTDRLFCKQPSVTALYGWDDKRFLLVTAWFLIRWTWYNPFRLLRLTTNTKQGLMPCVLIVILG